MEQRIYGTAVPQDMDRLSVMRRVLEGLPETTLIVFMAHRVEGKRYAEIARELGISEWRVERHMVRAITRIADVGERYRAALAALDPVSRQVLELTWDGLSNDRIAAHPDYLAKTFRCVRLGQVKRARAQAPYLSAKSVETSARISSVSAKACMTFRRHQWSRRFLKARNTARSSAPSASSGRFSRMPGLPSRRKLLIPRSSPSVVK